jgi:hypothetical protein
MSGDAARPPLLYVVLALVEMDDSEGDTPPLLLLVVVASEKDRRGETKGR